MSAGGGGGGSRPYLRRLCWPWWWWWPGRWSWYPSWCPSQTQSGGERDERALGPARNVHPRLFASCLLLGGQEATWHRTREALRTSCDCRAGEALERRLERTVTPRKRASRRHRAPPAMAISVRAGAPLPAQAPPSHLGGGGARAHRGRTAPAPRCCRHVPATSLGFGKGEGERVGKFNQGLRLRTPDRPSTISQRDQPCGPGEGGGGHTSWRPHVLREEDQAKLQVEGRASCGCVFSLRLQSKRAQPRGLGLMAKSPSPEGPRPEASSMLRVLA